MLPAIKTMKRYLFVLLVAIMLILAVPAKGVVHAAQDVCEQIVPAFFADPNWREALLDPAFTTREEVQLRYQLYNQIHNCLLEENIPVTGEEAAEALPLMEFYLTLVGGLVSNNTTAGEGYLVRFEDLRDPAVLSLRNEVGLPVPEGYLYVWLYTSVDDMPENVARYFRNPNVRGLTLLTRYVIVIDQVARLQETARGTPLEDFQRDQRSRVFSHEFVHAYVKSLLGTEHAFRLPEWYDEGLAIYFSGSSDPSSIAYVDENGRQVYYSLAPENYARYRDAFLFMEAEYGRERLLELIRRSVLEIDPGLLYRELGAENEEQLFAMARASRVDAGLNRLLYTVFGFTVAVLVLFLVPKAVERSREAVSERRNRDPLDAYYLRGRGDLRGLHRMLRHHYNSTDSHQVQSRLAAVEATADVDDPHALDILIETLHQDGSSTVRAAAARGIGQMADLRRPVTLLGESARVSVLSALFPALHTDSAEEVRMRAIEAIYCAGGTAALRPLESVLREEIVNKRASPAFQHWFVNWAEDVQLLRLIVDLYPWLNHSARRAAVERLRWHLTPQVMFLLESASLSGDLALRELAEAVLGQQSTDPSETGDMQEREQPPS
jgi:hypothetical protein